MPSFAVHIFPAKEVGGSFGDDPFHNLKDVTLKNVLAQIYDVAPVRIHLPPLLDNDKRYDITLVLPEDESTEVLIIALSRGFRTILALPSGVKNVCLPFML
jgi:hypothetical protein